MHSVFVLLKGYVLSLWDWLGILMVHLSEFYIKQPWVLTLCNSFWKFLKRLNSGLCFTTELSWRKECNNYTEYCLTITTTPLHRVIIQAVSAQSHTEKDFLQEQFLKCSFKQFHVSQYLNFSSNEGVHDTSVMTPVWAIQRVWIQHHKHCSTELYNLR